MQVPLLPVQRQGPFVVTSPWHFTRGQESAARGRLLNWEQGNLPQTLS